jgi:2-oxoisovalerate dehydrogenase E2 component (dihydrolipoyl transacylase)
MAEVFRLPDLGEGLREAELIAWHVGVGDHVVTDQPLVSIETDKALVDVPSPHSGRIAALHGAPGDIVAVGAPLVEFSEVAAIDKGTVVGELEPTAPAAAAPPAARRPTTEHGRAAPAVRRLAAELGVDLAMLRGSGVEGTITRADVENAAHAAAKPLPGAQRIRGVRRAMLLNMTRAGREVVPATVTDEADVDAWPAHTDPTIRLIRAIAAACRIAPALNAWFDAATESRTLHERVDLGIAVETDEGLFAPVVRDVAGKNASELRSAVDAIKAAVASRSLERERLVRQTITLSNFGMFGGQHADLVVVPPQVAILGAGRIGARAVVVDGAVVAHRTVPLSLTFDHRAVTGVEAARFLMAVIADLERPE